METSGNKPRKRQPNIQVEHLLALEPTLIAIRAKEPNKPVEILGIQKVVALVPVNKSEDIDKLIILLPSSIPNS